jgi:hypothetical protein
MNTNVLYVRLRKALLAAFMRMTLVTSVITAILA